MEQNSADYRTVAVFVSVPDAESARGLLESDGIIAAVRHAVEATAVRTCTVRLLVPARDLDRARSLLTPAPVPDPADLDPAALDAAPSAPESDPTWTVGWLALLVAAAVALLAAFVL